MKKSISQFEYELSVAMANQNLFNKNIEKMLEGHEKRLEIAKASVINLLN